MSFISNILNPSQGAGFQAQGPGAAQVQSGLQQQQDLVNALGAQGGLGAQNQALQMAQQGAAGAGPNPALAQLNQTTGQNIAAQGALQAGQRGASSNAGMYARQAGQQGGALQQQAVGQGATMAANQQLQQQQLAQQQANQLANQQIGATQNQSQQLLGAQANANNVNGNIAKGNQSSQSGIMGSLGQAIGPGLNLLQSAGSGIMDGLGSFGSSLGTFAGGAGDALGAVGSGIGAGVETVGPEALMLASKGGEIPHAPSSNIGKHFHSMKSGGKVAGKASVPGDSLKNDNVKAMLSPGEVVIPRSVMQGKDPASGAAKFVAAIMMKKGKS